MIKIKRAVSIILSTVLILFCCSCVNSKPRTLSDNLTIPESGIIDESIFLQLKDENSIGVFTGESNGIKYEWTVFGSNISAPKTLNMLVALNKSTEEKSIEFEFSSSENFGFCPMLSIFLDERWDAGSATVFSETDGKLSPVCSASITGTDASILNFSMTETCGRYIIKADKEEQFDGIVYTDNDKKNPAETLESSDENIRDFSADESVIQGSDDVKEEDLSDDEGYENAGSDSEQGSDFEKTYSDGRLTDQDKYLTDPIPEGKPMPVEPDKVQIDDSKIMTCTFSIECTSILNNLTDLEPEKLDILPSDGIIFPPQTVEFKEGESVFDLLQRVCRENGIHLETSMTPVYNTAYIEGINNIYEFDCGSLSGWVYRVNDWYPNYGCSRYCLSEGDIVEWRFTCDLGKDVGCGLLSR